MKEYERNAFGHVSSLAGNKYASFSCLDMETRPRFLVFHFSNFGLHYLRNVQADVCEFTHFYRIREGGGSGRPPYHSFENR